MEADILEFPRGAEWRKWDLHIHSKASDGKADCEEIVQTSLEKGISVIALTDHHTVDNIDEIRSAAKQLGIYAIAGIEFRSEYGAKSVHFIGLFPEQYGEYKLDAKNLHDLVLAKLDLSPAKIIAQGKKRLLEENKSDVTEEVAFKYGIHCVQVDFKLAADVIHNLGGLVVPHAGGKTHGIEKEMKHEGKPGITLYDSLGTLKQELFEQDYIDVYEISPDVDDATFYFEKFGKSSIVASDAHTANDIGSRFTWIKADPTFSGLRQALKEPQTRICFGTEPEVLQRLRARPTKYFDSVQIDQVQDYSGDSGKWFSGTEVVFNPELVAIIGNKGSGKSALADILGLCTNSKREENFSFLHRTRFRKKGLANNFIANLSWVAGADSNEHNLMDEVDLTGPERAKYLPQGYFEELCNEIESVNQFTREINEVVFQHVPEGERLDRHTFEGFLEHKRRVIDSELTKLRSRLHKKNREISKLERLRNPNVRAEYQNELDQKQNELDSLTKPRTVRSPSKKKTKSKKDLLEKISSLDEDISSLATRIEKSKSSQNSLNKDLENLRQFRKEVLGYKEEIEDFIKQRMTLFRHLKDVDPSSIIKISIDIEPIERVEKLIKASIKDVNIELSDTPQSDEEGREESLVVKKLGLEAERQKLRNQLDAPSKRYQEYLEAKEVYDEEKSKIVGTKSTPGTIKFYSDRLEYLDKKLGNQLVEERESRYQIVLQIFNLKKEIVQIYYEVKQHVTNALDQHFDNANDYPVQIDSELVLDPKFFSETLSHINKAVLGTYKGVEDAQSILSKQIEDVEFNDFFSIQHFLDDVIASLEVETKGDEVIQRYIDEQISDMEGFYDFLFGLEYLKENYQLKLGKKSLDTLSPGEKGALLLVFYLLLDKNDIPLILDQPEDNLDNQSVFQILVPFIKEAKTKRQIIMITHNPNLAVVADAEQVIRVDILKDEHNEYVVKSGSIENPIMKKAIVDVLEGTMPAFDNRSGKYHDWC